MMLHRFYPYEHAESVFAIDYDRLYAMGYRGVIFDIDNTLVHHGEDATPQVEALFRRIHRIGLKTLLLSNNDTERIERFLTRIDSLFIPDAEKPNPKNYHKAVQMLGIRKEQAVVVGDQLFTDIFGANRAGIANILVDFLRRDSETKLGKRRRLEQLVLRCYERSGRYQNRIGTRGTKGERP